MLADRILHQL